MAQMSQLVIFLLIAVSYCVFSAFAACTLKFNRAKPGLFVKKTGHHTQIVDPASGIIQFDSISYILANCTSGFKNYGNVGAKPEVQLKFTCVGDSIRYQAIGVSITHTAKNDGTMYCESMSRFYSQSVPYCTKTGMAYGFNARNVPVTFGNVCYNAKTQRTEFAHYVTGERNDLVDDQVMFNPSPRPAPLPAKKALNVDASIQTKERESIPKAVSVTGNYANLMNYKLGSLIPVQNQAGILRPYTASIQNAAAVPYWSNLQNYNWRRVQECIGNASLSGGYDVYAGVSDDVYVPYENFNVTLTYKVGPVTQTLPMYVWNWVKSRTDRKDQGVVIVGVNSPFFIGETSQTVLCKDMCNRIPWMAPLSNTRTIASMGYVFCCYSQEVRRRLHGFPQIPVQPETDG